MIAPLGKSLSFKGVYYQNVDKKALSQDEKVALASLGDCIMADTYVKDYDFDFGKVKETPDGKGIHVKISLDNEESGFKRAFLPLENSYKTIKNNLEILREKVFEHKSDIYKTCEDPIEENLCD